MHQQRLGHHWAGLHLRLVKERVRLRDVRFAKEHKRIKLITAASLRPPHRHKIGSCPSSNRATMAADTWQWCRMMLVAAWIAMCTCKRARSATCVL
eukprot:14894743-Alexandrium_andersonii.AAC.1